MIVILKGGLGNQMFQYAFGRSVSLARKEPLYFDRNQPDNDERRCYALGVFDRPIAFASAQQPIYYESPFSFNPQVYHAQAATFDGHWQTEKYFDAPLIRRVFGPQRMDRESEQVATEVAALKGHSAFLHVRRTDYLLGDNPLWYTHLTQEDYYQAAILRVRQRDPDVRWFVFSDDPEWCRTAFPSWDFKVISHNKPGGRLFGTTEPGTEHEDIWLMSLCRHAVIANSSFSWWGAWLGDSQPDRMVVAPSRWFGPNYTALDTHDIVPERWARI